MLNDHDHADAIGLFDSVEGVNGFGGAATIRLYHGGTVYGEVEVPRWIDSRVGFVAGDLS
jgi:hypothetical protein